jgi:hypothetical protein
MCDKDFIFNDGSKWNLTEYLKEELENVIVKFGLEKMAWLEGDPRETLMSMLVRVCVLTLTSPSKP